jgi:hypothetical protein
MKHPHSRQAPRPADKDAERDRVSALIIGQQRTQMLQKTARLRQLRLARDAQLAPPVATVEKKPKSKSNAAK